jgi:hypothetical protein
VTPVQPGWVVVPADKMNGNEWYHLVGWAGLEPVIAAPTGVMPWRELAGADPYCIATLEEWCGKQC